MLYGYFYETILPNWTMKTRLLQDVSPIKTLSKESHSSERLAMSSDLNRITKGQGTQKTRPLGRARDALGLPEAPPLPQTWTLLLHSWYRMKAIKMTLR